MSMLGNYSKVALRNLARHKVYSAINIIGLAVGMGACIVILLWVRFHLSFDSFHRQADQICQLLEHQSYPGSNPRDIDCTVPAMGPALERDYPEVEDFCRIKEVPGYLVVWNGDKGFTVDKALLTDPSFLRMFDFPAVSGAIEGALDEPDNLVLTRTFARKIFGDRDPVGSTLVLSYLGTRLNFRVAAVVEPAPANSSLQFDLLAPLSLKEHTSPGWLNQWGFNEPYTYLRLSPGADYKTLENKIDRELLARYNPEIDQYIGLYLLPLRQTHLRAPFSSGPSVRQLLLLAALALVILLVACINYTNLSIARLSRRAREVALRKTLGAGRFQLVGQFLAESVQQTLLALLLAIALVELTLPWLNPHLGNILQLNYRECWQLLLPILLATVLVGLLTGLYPALAVSSFRLTSILKGQLGEGAGRHSLRRLLIVAQFTASTVMLIGTLVAVRQIDFLLHKDIGLDREHVVCLPLGGELGRRFESLRGELLSRPGIVAVTAQRHQFWSDSHTTAFMRYEGQTPGESDSQYLEYLLVDRDFIRFFGMKLVAGRDFPESLTAGSQNLYIINETLARRLGWEPQAAVGKRVAINTSEMGQVLGVVQDFPFRPLNETIEPFAFQLAPPGNLGLALVRIAPGHTTNALALLESRWRELMPERPFEYTFLDQDFDHQFAAYRHSAVIVSLFSVLSVSIACLGLLGLITQAAESRTKEIGIRKVLGASAADIVLLLSHEFMLLLGISVLIAWPVAWWLMHRWLENFAYRISLDWWIFALAGVIALVVAAAAVGFQAFKAATADPVRALRYE